MSTVAGWYLVTWIAFSCPGGWFSAAVPAAAQPYVCTRHPARLITSRREDASRQVRAVGQGAAPTLAWCRGLRCWDKTIEWKTVAEIK